MTSAMDIVAALKMQRHPEGGWYAETFRDPGGAPRGHSTAIYYLLEAGERSHWHRIDAAEVWHWYGGATLDLQIASEDLVSTHALGPDILAGERPQVVVPRGAWQAARSSGDWTLVGCTVAPGFDFAGFELAPPEWTPGR